MLLTLVKCVWLSAAPYAQPWAPSLGAPQQWDLRSSLGSSTWHIQALRDLSGYILANRRWGRKHDAVFTVLQQSQVKQSQMRAQCFGVHSHTTPSLCQTKEIKS